VTDSVDTMAVTARVGNAGIGDASEPSSVVKG
jgi:hypothetical protein